MGDFNLTSCFRQDVWWSLILHWEKPVQLYGASCLGPDSAVPSTYRVACSSGPSVLCRRSSGSRLGRTSTALTSASALLQFLVSFRAELAPHGPDCRVNNYIFIAECQVQCYTYVISRSLLWMLSLQEDAWRRITTIRRISFFAVFMKTGPYSLSTVCGISAVQSSVWLASGFTAPRLRSPGSYSLALEKLGSPVCTLLS